jgi:putative ABC transport system substrate-binding protein
MAALIDLGFQPSEGFEADIEAAALVLRLSIQRLEASNDREIEAAFTKLIEARVDAVLVGPGPFLDSRRDLLVGLSAKAAIPAAYETRATAVAGGLISYGASVSDGYRQAGIYTGRILHGAKPSELPILQPTEFELVINLKTAKTLGLTVPPTLLTTADEVIE